MIKRWLILLMGIVPLLAAAPAAGREEAARAEIDRVLTAWHKAAAEADEIVYFGTLAPQAVFLGTDAGERWTKEEFEKWAAPYFQRSSAWIFRAEKRWITVAPDGRTAWFDELLYSESYWTCRGSGVLRRIGGKWLICQYNLAFTIPNAVTREIKPLVEKALKTE